MKVVRVLTSIAVVPMTTLSVSTPGNTYTRAQCNAPYTGCLAKCGNRVTQSGANYQQLKKACLDSCAAEKTRCLWGAADKKGGRHGH